SRQGGYEDGAIARLKAAERGDFHLIGGFTGGYVRLLRTALQRPLTVLVLCLLTLVASFVFYGQHGHGVEFFPDVDSDIGL
ncbi:hypothetical protein Q4595_29790, partial [Wenyingzhuangia sp. 1_MG-2023]|nr:hypothetical protein [Wenyingzhuangia sp. 1_MG-2023]